MLFFDDEYHFSVVYDINESVVVLNDPSIGLFELNKNTFDGLFSGYVLDLEHVKNRGVNVSITQMKTIVGSFIIECSVAYGVIIGATIIVGALAVVWQSNSHYKSHKVSLPKYKYHKTPINRIKFPRYVKYPTSYGKNGYKPQMSMIVHLNSIISLNQKFF